MKKVLIANRGEIALRVIRACHDMGLQTVAVYSEADAESLHVLNADEAICIGEPPSAKSYLKIPALISSCEVTGADAVHPGYGFLAENAKFASICESCGLTFIGPSPSSISELGDKAKAKATALKAGCPVIPGSDGVIGDVDDALEVAQELGFPVFIKAVAGGGGKGIRIAHDEREFKRLFLAAKSEAEVSFSNPDVYLEKMIVTPRHVEVQVVGDRHGNVIYLGERDCSIQRRRQKLIEEAPSPYISDDLRRRMGEAAVAVARQAGYYSAGTVEFLVDRDHQFYFMEMNTRIQVEHTVTEELTGVDLVREQIRVAMGKPLSVTQEQVRFKGHVVQFRVNAENPHTGFTPCPGKLEYFVPPGGPGVRVDTACYSGYKVPPHYDAMIAKLIVKGENREEALAVGSRALREFHVGGISTTIPFHLFMLQNDHFVSGDYDINYVDALIAKGCTFTINSDDA